MNKPIITVTNASVTYNQNLPSQVEAIKNANIEIYPEEFIILFGPSGCGKSTLLYAISGLENLTTGKITILGRNLAQMSKKEITSFHRVSIGMVFQAYYLISSIKVLANIILPQIFLNISSIKRISKCAELLKRFGISEIRDRYPTELSGGQQQRVAIARALINDPPILLADEPVGNLDSKSAESVMQLLTELNTKDKKTIILVTHNPNHLSLAHRVIYIKDGRIEKEVINENKEIKREEKISPFENYGLKEFASVYPHLSEKNLKIKMLSEFLLDELDITEKIQIEDSLASYYDSVLSKEHFIQKLASSPKSGGAGLYYQHAERITNELNSILNLGRFIKNNIRSFPRDYGAYENLLSKIMMQLFSVADIHPNEEQNRRIKNAIKARIEGSLNKTKFQDVLDRPISEDGAGLNIRTAKNMARLMELILIDPPDNLNVQKADADKTVLESKFKAI